MKKILCFVLLVACCWQLSMACTSIIVSRKASKNGRAMILKNRDTGELSNFCHVFQGPKYRYLGLANTRDTDPEEVWGGHNEKGFAIINTADYNLNKVNHKQELEGEFMRMALGICETLADFEQFLDTIARPHCVNTNFGVIDAYGGCAYYETNNDGYVKYDANDPKVAPNGYLMRTNFGFSGDSTKQQGVERYLAIERLMADAYESQNMTADFLIRNVTHNLKHGLTQVDLTANLSPDYNSKSYAHFTDFIPRHSTSAALLVEGVLDGESPALTTCWMYVGFPLTTPVIPLVITKSGRLPKALDYYQVQGYDNLEGVSAMNMWGLQLKSKLFDWPQKSKNSYINVSHLINKEGTGIMQQVSGVENAIIAEAMPVLQKIRQKGKLSSSVEQYYQWIDKYLEENYFPLVEKYAKESQH